MGPKFLHIILPSGKELVSNDVKLDPEQPDDWPEVACYAEALRRIASDELVALILRADSGGLDINVEQCLAVLEQCRQRGITPDANLAARLYGAFLEGIDKVAASGKSRSTMPN
jgi:hypothetical protein